jgi:hypothetical protein
MSQLVVVALVTGLRPGLIVTDQDERRHRV